MKSMSRTIPVSFKKRLLIPAVGIAFALAAPAIAGTVSGTDILREYNLVVLGNLTSSSEVEGRTFVGGDLSGNSSNYNISQIPASSNGKPGLTVVGDVNGGHKNLNNGSGAIVGGNVNSGFNLNGAAQTVQVGGTISNTNVNQNTVQSGLSSSNPAFTQSLQQDKSLISTSANNLSYDLSTLSSNSDFAIQGNKGVFSAQPDADGVAVFNITSADLDKIGEIQFNLNGADTAIVNVSGTSITLNDNFLGGTNNLGESVIWNFHEAEDLTLTTAFGGSVLAPKADAVTKNYIQGSAIFGNLVQDGEMHVGTYNGGYYPPPPSSSSSSTGGNTSSGGTEVPEPGMVGLFGAGLAALYFIRRRRKKLA